jgi:tellurite resistance protein
MVVDRTDEEELYFAQQDQEARRRLREQLAGNAVGLEEQQRIAQSMGTSNVTVAEKVKALGFDGDSARVFDLVPLIHVAWADGSVQRGERAAIFKVLQKRGVEDDSGAWRTIASLLEERPSDAWMRQSLAVLREVTGGISGRSQEIVDLCIEVATASGGLLGLGIGKKIDAEERALIEEIVGTLGDAAADKVKQDMA